MASVVDAGPDRRYEVLRRGQPAGQEQCLRIEDLIVTSGPADKTVPANDGGNAKDSGDDDDEETYLDESDDIGNIDDGMSVRDIDDDGQISEEESDYDNYDDTNDNEEEEA